MHRLHTGMLDVHWYQITQEGVARGRLVEVWQIIARYFVPFRTSRDDVRALEMSALCARNSNLNIKREQNTKREHGSQGFHRLRLYTLSKNSDKSRRLNPDRIHF